MSANYKPVSWTRSKLRYDAVVLGAIAIYLLVYLRLGPGLQRVTLPPDDQTMTMKAYGSCAFLLLTAILCIGPLARLDRRFLPVLYNRRHLGVMTASVAAGHALAVLDWYFAYSPVPPLLALLGADTSFGQLHGFPFIPFGLFAFIVLLAMAATSHDFWLAFLTPPVWKALHMAVYAAYGALVLHVGLGALQDVRDPTFAIVVGLSVVAVCTLHVAAARREHRRDAALAPLAAESPWIDAGPVDAIPDGRAIVVRLTGGEPVAIFRNGNTLSAVSGVCAHQNGPLGEGRVVDGCITCPWHGYQYRLEDGCAPPPFTERIATYPLRRDGARVLLDPRPNAPGTPVPPLEMAP
ncbi:MAG: ferric reductase-like transmembrane domain-containing protein [Devosia sp.]|nr:ferric reductase-like transmembrane domain-containing protein [Devosia sp.]